MKNVTRKDIAEKLGVSVSVVSRVINNSGYVSKEKREKVLKAAKEMGYVQNPVAMALQQNKTKQLLFFCEDLTSTYYNQMYHGMVRAAKERGYHVLTVMDENDFEMVKETITDGILFPNEMVAEAYAASVGRNYNLPAVTACFNPGMSFSKAMPAVTIDNEEVINKAIDYLIGLGHKKIGMTLPFSYGYVDLRFRYWEERMKQEIGIGYEKYIIDVQDRVKRRSNTRGIKIPCPQESGDFLCYDWFYIGKEVAEFYVSMRYKPTVILCFNDDIAFGTIEYLKKLGIRVPDDVSVMGIDGLFTRDKYTPKLTTVNMYPELQGAKCAEILIDILNGFKYKYIYKFKVSILEGESVKKIKCRESREIRIAIKSDKKSYRYIYTENAGGMFELGKGLVAGLATEGTRTMTFTGTYLAMFAERGRGYFKELNVKVSDADKEDDR